MVLPHSIERDKALPNASQMLMAAQDEAARPVASPFVPVAAAISRVKGGIAAAPRLRRAPEAIQKVQSRPKRYFTSVASRARPLRPNRASLILMAASHKQGEAPHTAYGLPMQPRHVDTLDLLQRRIRAIMVRDTLQKRFDENQMDLVDGRLDLPRLIDAEARFTALFSNRPAQSRSPYRLAI